MSLETDEIQARYQRGDLVPADLRRSITISGLPGYAAPREHDIWILPDGPYLLAHLSGPDGDWRCELIRLVEREAG